MSNENKVVLPNTVSDEQIKAVFLANGFTIKEGLTDLKPYVYQAARALLATATGLPAQAVHDRHSVAPNIDKWKLVDGDMRESCDGLLTYHADAYREGLADAPQTQADARDAESDYQRGYRHGYNRRDAEVQGALL